MFIAAITSRMVVDVVMNAQTSMFTNPLTVFGR